MLTFRLIEKSSYTSYTLKMSYGSDMQNICFIISSMENIISIHKSLCNTYNNIIKNLDEITNPIKKFRKKVLDFLEKEIIGVVSKIVINKWKDKIEKACFEETYKCLETQLQDCKVTQKEDYIEFEISIKENEKNNNEFPLKKEEKLKFYESIWQTKYDSTMQNLKKESIFFTSIMQEEDWDFLAKKINKAKKEVDNKDIEFLKKIVNSFWQFIKICNDFYQSYKKDQEELKILLNKSWKQDINQTNKIIQSFNKYINNIHNENSEINILFEKIKLLFQELEVSCFFSQNDN